MQDALDQRIRLIRSLPAKARVPALAEAIAITPSLDERSRLAIELLELTIPPAVSPRSAPWDRWWASARARLADEALARTARLWHHLPADARSHFLLIAGDRWQVVLDALAGEPEAAPALAELAEASGDPALVSHLPILLLDERASEVAEQALLRLTCASLSLPVQILEPDLKDTSARTNADLAEVAQALPRVARRALSRIADHQRRGVALCALLLGAFGRARELLPTRREEPAAQAMRGVLRFSHAPATRLCAFRLLEHPILGEPALERVSRAHHLGDHEVVLSAGHLSLSPGRARRLRTIAVRARTTPAPPSELGEVCMRLTLPRESALPDGSLVESLSTASRRQLPRVAAQLADDDLTLRAVLDPMLADTDDLSRYAAMRQSPEATLRDYCLDPSEPVARGAMLRWSLVGADHYATAPVRRRHMELLNKLRRSPHAWVRRIAAEDHARLDCWGSLSPASLLVARRRYAHDGEAFLVDLRHVLMSGSTDERVRAIAIASRLEILDRIESLLVALVTQSASQAVDPRVVASAVKALGRLDSVPARQTVRWALRHTDARVRANAVEAMARQRGGSLDTPTRQTLVELKQDAHQRVRANAICALLDSGEDQHDTLYAPSATSALIAMLRDERPAHRTSALWVAEHATGRSPRGDSSKSADAVLAHVQTMAAQDPDPGVRTRAARLIRTLHRRRAALASTSARTTSDNTPGLSSIGGEQRC